MIPFHLFSNQKIITNKILKKLYNQGRDFEKSLTLTFDKNN